MSALDNIHYGFEHQMAVPLNSGLFEVMQVKLEKLEYRPKVHLFQ